MAAANHQHHPWYKAYVYMDIYAVLRRAIACNPMDIREVSGFRSGGALLCEREANVGNSYKVH